MSPHLLFLLTALHAHHQFTRERDRIDARLAATRMGVRRLMSRHATPDDGGPLPERG